MNDYDDVLDEQAQTQAVTAPPASVYDQVLDEQAGAQERSLRGSFAQAAETSPDRAAEVQRLSAITAIPPAIVDRDFDGISKRVQIDGKPYEQMMRESPALTSWLTEKPEHAAVAQDDLEQLGAIEWLVTAPQRAYGHGVAQLEVGRLRTKSILAPLTAEEQTQLGNARAMMTEGGALGAGESWFRNAVVGAVAQIPNIFGAALKGAERSAYTIPAALGVGFGAAAVMGTAPLSLPVLFGAGLGAGMMTGAAEATFSVETGLAYDEFLDFRDELGQPLAPEAAKAAAWGAGLLNAGLEVAGLEVLAESIPGVKNLKRGVTRNAVKAALRSPTIRAALFEAGKTYTSTLASETAVEVAQRAVTLMAGELGKYASGQDIKHLTSNEIVSDLWSEALSAAQSFSLLSLPGPAMGLAVDTRRAKQAAQNEGFFKALGEGVTNSKTVQRQPQAAQDFIARATKDGPIENLYAPIGTWTTYWQGKGVDPAEMATELTGNPRAYAEAQATGLDLTIPTAAYAVKLAGTEHNTALSQELRLAPDAMNAREAQEFIAEQEAAAAEAQPAPSADQVRQDVLQKLQTALAGTGIKLPAGALERYADVYQAVVGTLAEHEGIDPGELFQRYGLEILGPGEVGPGGLGSSGPAAPAAPSGTAAEAPTVDDLDIAVAVASGVPIAPEDAIALQHAGFDVPVETPSQASSQAASVNRDAPTYFGTGAGADIARAAAAMRAENPNIDKQAEAMKAKAAAVGRIPEPTRAGEAAPIAAETTLEQPPAPHQAQQLLDAQFPPGSPEREELVRLRATSTPEDFKAFLEDVFTPRPQPDAMSLHAVGGTDGPQAFAWGFYAPSLRALAERYQAFGAAAAGLVPSEDTFLEWDLPASRQPVPVKQALRALGVQWSRGSDPTGGEIYRSLSVGTVDDPSGAAEASRVLHQHGILGTRYSDGGLPNYVSFDKSLGPVELWQSERPKGFDAVAAHLTPAERDKLKRDHAERLVAIFRDLPADRDWSDVALAGIAKRGWYRESALAILHIFGNVDGPRFAALLAATSPQTSVEVNLFNALSIWKNWNKAGRPTDRKSVLKVMARSVQGNKGVDSVLASWVPNTVRALSGDDPKAVVLSGPKVHSFYRNLIGEVNEVTNDAWMASFALLDKTILGGSINKAGTDPGKGPGYLAMVAKVRRVAKRLTESTGELWTPDEVQETVWSWSKSLYELAEAEGTDAETIVREGRLSDAAIASTPDFKNLFTTDPTVRALLEAAGYGEAITAFESEFGGSPDRRAGSPGGDGAAAGAENRAPTLGELRSARRLDEVKRQRQEAARLKAGTELHQELRPAFYSRILETINQAQTTKASGAQWKATVKNSKLGVNADEYAMTHVDDLEDGKSYTRDEVLQYLRTHRVEVSQVVLGDPDAPNARTEEQQAKLERQIERRAQELYDEAIDAERQSAEQNFSSDLRYSVVEGDTEEIGDPDNEGETIEITKWRVVAHFDRHYTRRNEHAAHDDEFDSEEDAQEWLDSQEGQEWRWELEDAERDAYMEGYDYDASYSDAEEKARRELEGDEDDVEETHYGEYTLKGLTEKGSYREAFVTAEKTTLPVAAFAASRDAATRKVDVARVELARLGVEISNLRRDELARADMHAGEAFSPMVQTELDALQRRYDTQRNLVDDAVRELSVLEAQIDQEWTDGHSPYDHIQRPIVRLRFNVRNGYSLEELEAYRAQAPAESPVTLREAEDALKRINAPMRRLMFLEEVQPPTPRMFPKVPALFQKNWREIGFKWALRYAAEHNLDAVVWTTGAEQQDRYSLRKQVQSITWSTPIALEDSFYRDAEGTTRPTPITGPPAGWSKVEADPVRQIDIVTSSNSTLRLTVNYETGNVLHASGSASQWAGEHLSAVMGTELADQVLKGKDGVIRDEGLEVGGIGLARLYDVDFRNVVNALSAVKKNKGRASRFTIGTPIGAELSVKADARHLAGIGAEVAIVEPTAHGFLRVLRPMQTREDAERWLTETAPLPDEGQDRRRIITRPLHFEETVRTDGPNHSFISEGGDWFLRQWHAQDVAGNTVRTFQSQHQADEYVRGYNETTAQQKAIQSLNQGVEITPTIRDAVMAGQALFQPLRNEGGSYDSPARGKLTFGPDRKFSIQIFRDADVSTFMHESAHLFLEMLQDLAAAPTASARLTGDMEILRTQLFQIEPGASIGVEEHERFARAFEAYLMTGKAPSVGLRGLFNQFRAWLIGLYRTLGELNVTLTDDVRGVFDRMMASDRAILEAQAEFKVTPMFTTAEAAGMSPDEFVRYQATIEEASRKARETLEAKLLQEVRRAQKRAWRAQEDDTRDEVTKDVHQRPVYQALAAMRRGTRPDGTPIVEGSISEPLRLSRQILVDRYGEGVLRDLPRPTIYSVEGGLDPDVVGQMFGFSSGDAMIEAIKAAPPMQAAIDQETQQKMVERYGDLVLEGRVSEEAKAALANDKRDEIIRAELRALGQLRRTAAPFVQAGEQNLASERRERDYERRWFEAEAKLRIALAEGHKQIEIDELRNEVLNLRRKMRGGAATVRAGIPSESTLREAARSRIGRTRIRDIRPATFWSAAKRASTEATELAAKGDFDGAIVAKQNELINLALYRQASFAQEQAEKRVRQAQNLATPAARARLGRAGEDYLDQVDGILDRYDFARASQKVLDRRQALRQWVSQLEAQGLPVDIPDDVLDDARRIHYRDLPFDELLAVTDGLQQIVHLARLKLSLLQKRKSADLQATVAALAASIRDHATRRQPKAIETRLPADQAGRMIDAFFASHRKMASLAREMDGFEDGGAMWESVILPLNEAGDREAVMNAAATKALGGLVDTAFPGKEKARLYDKTFLPAINDSLTKMGRLMVALNWGNEGNRQRIMSGHGWNEHQVQAILDTLDQRDWQFVQGVWDFVDSYWPEIAAKQERVTGLAPEKVEAIEVLTKWGPMKGGYFPLKYDDRLSAQAGAHGELEAAQLQRQAAYVQASTRRGHTKERMAKVTLPVRLDFGPIFEHVAQVIHDLSHHEALIDIGRIMGHRDVQAAIYDTYGDIVYKQFRNGLKDVAVGTPAATEAHERVFNHLRVGATIAGLGWNLTTAFLQPLGLTQSMVRIGPTWVARGLGRWMRDAATMENTVAWILEKSDLMKLRGQTQQREINEIRNQVGANTGKVSGWVEEILNTVTFDQVSQAGIADSYFFLIQQLQRIADVPTWLGQYEKSMAAGETEARAIELADQAVIDAQGGGQTKDLAAVQRGPAAWKLWTNFYSFFSTTYNLTAESTRRTKFNQPGAIGRLAVDYMLLYIVPATLGFMLRQAMKGQAPDPDDKKYLEAMIRDSIAYTMGGVMGLRELSGAVQGFYGYEGPAGARAFANASKLIKQASQGEADAAFWRALNDTAGVLFHYPSGQVRRTIEGIVAIAEGRTKNPGALIVGPPAEKK